MKKILALSLLASTLCAFAQETPPAAAPVKDKPVKKKLSLLDYRPPETAGTVARKDGDGASRAEIMLPDGRMITLPKLYALTPHKGLALTTKAKPTLFTFQTDKVPSPVQYRATINRIGQPAPVWRQVALSSEAGFHRLDLAESDVTLEPGVEYKWVVVIRPDRNKPSDDVEAWGMIKRIVPDAALAAKIAEADSADLPGIYAEAGIWYDALESISDQIAANPKDQELSALRKTFLERAGLNLKIEPGPAPTKPKQRE